MSDPNQSLEAADNTGNPGLSEQDPSEAVKQIDNPDGEPEAEGKEETEQPLYGDRNPNWTEKDVPPRRTDS
jgi:hypothetical protein